MLISTKTKYFQDEYRLLYHPLHDAIWSFTLQVSIRLDGENKAVEYNAVGLTKDAVRAVFKNPEVDNLFDRNWHKIALSVEAKSVSLFLDCKHIQTLPIEEREDIDIQGKTVIGKRLYDSVPIDVSAHSCRDNRLLRLPDVKKKKKSCDISFIVMDSSDCLLMLLQFDLQRMMIYCDSKHAELETCCDLPNGPVSQMPNTSSKCIIH